MPEEIQGLYLVRLLNVFCLCVLSWVKEILSGVLKEPVKKIETVIFDNLNPLLPGEAEQNSGLSPWMFLCNAEHWQLPDEGVSVESGVFHVNSNSLFQRSPLAP